MASTDFNIGGVEGQIASLSSQVTALNTHIENVETVTTTPDGTNASSSSLFRAFVWDNKIGMAQISFNPKIALAANTDNAMCSIPSAYAPNSDMWGIAFDRVNGQVAYLEINLNGRISIRSNSQIATSTLFRGEIIWFVGK